MTSTITPEEQPHPQQCSFAENSMFKIDRVNSSMLCMVRGKLCITIATAFTVTMATHMVLFMMFVDKQLINTVALGNEYDGNLKIKSIQKRHITPEENNLSEEGDFSSFDSERIADETFGFNNDFGMKHDPSIINDEDNRVAIYPEMDNNVQRKILGNKVETIARGDSRNTQNSKSLDQNSHAQMWISKTFHNIKSKVLNLRQQPIDSNTDRQTDTGNKNKIVKDLQSIQPVSEVIKNKIAQKSDLFSHITDTQYSSDNHVGKFDGNNNNNLKTQVMGPQNHASMNLPDGMVLLNAQNINQKDISELISKVKFQEINIAPNKGDEEWDATDDWNMEHLIVAVTPKRVVGKVSGIRGTVPKSAFKTIDKKVDKDIKKTSQLLNSDKNKQYSAANSNVQVVKTNVKPNEEHSKKIVDNKNAKDKLTNSVLIQNKVSSDSNNQKPVIIKKLSVVVNKSKGQKTVSNIKSGTSQISSKSSSHIIIPVKQPLLLKERLNSVKQKVLLEQNNSLQRSSDTNSKMQTVQKMQKDKMDPKLQTRKLNT